TGVVNLTQGDKLGKKWKDAFGYFLSADGTKLLYTVHDGNSGQVALANADGSEPRLIAPELGYIYMATLSPTNDRVVFSGPAHGSAEGKRIAHVATKDGVPTVYIMNIDGREQRQITFRKTPCGRARWSPDGKRIAFVSFEGKYPQLFVVAANGGEPRQLTRL